MKNVLYLAHQDLCTFKPRDLRILAQHLQLSHTIDREKLCWQIAIKLHGSKQAQMPTDQIWKKYQSQLVARLWDDPANTGFADLTAFELFQDADPTNSKDFFEWLITSYLNKGIPSISDLNTVKAALQNFVAQEYDDIHRYCGLVGCGDKPGLQTVVSVTALEPLLPLAPTQRAITDRHDISSIDDLLPLFEELRASDKQVLGIFDWDNTISLENGCNLPLRQGSETIHFFQYLNATEVPWFVLTARLDGDSLMEDHHYVDVDIDDNYSEPAAAPEPKPAPALHVKQERFNRCLKGFVEHMHQSLPPLGESATLQGLDPINPIGIKSDNNTVLIYNKVVFGGGGKGDALAKLFETQRIPQDADYYIFVDNDSGHVESVEEEFEERGIRDKLIPVHYEQHPLLMCSSGEYFPMTECLLTE